MKKLFLTLLLMAGTMLAGAQQVAFFSFLAEDISQEHADNVSNLFRRTIDPNSTLFINQSVVNRILGYPQSWGRMSGSDLSEVCDQLDASYVVAGSVEKEVDDYGFEIEISVFVYDVNAHRTIFEDDAKLINETSYGDITKRLAQRVAACLASHNPSFRQSSSGSNSGSAEQSNWANISQWVARNLVGKVISDHSSTSYFPANWTWTLKQEAIHEVTITSVQKEGASKAITATVRLSKGNLLFDGRFLIHCGNVNGKAVFEDITTLELAIVEQTDYLEYVDLEMDYDFIPMLKIHNRSGITLFVGGEYETQDGPKRFCATVEPNATKPLGIGSPYSYRLHFAQRQ